MKITSVILKLDRSIPYESFLPLEFDEVEFAIGKSYWEPTKPDQFKADEDGVYHVTGSLMLKHASNDAVQMGAIEICAIKNGIESQVVATSVTPATFTHNTVNFSTYVNLKAGDFINLRVWQRTTRAMTLMAYFTRAQFAKLP